MNRQEALEKLENFYYWNYDDEEYDQETGRNHKQNLEDIIKYLKQPIILTDFLGWEEDVEYELNDYIYKISKGSILYRSLFSGKYEMFCSKYLSQLREAKKITPKKYNLILQRRFKIQKFS